MNKNSKSPKKPKLPPGLTEEFVQEVETESHEQLKTRIVTMQGQLDEVQSFLKENEDVLELKASYDEAAAPSRETIKALRARTKFIVESLKKSGGL